MRWLAGLPASGKSTLARRRKLFLKDNGLLVAVVQGDVLRTGLSCDLGYSAADRRENVRRAGLLPLFTATDSPHEAPCRPPAHRMSETFPFISGLPRSGSSRRAANRCQNPVLHAAMTSPAGSLFDSLPTTTAQKNEFFEFFDAKQRERVLRGIFALCHQDFTQEVIPDPNRLWCARFPRLLLLFPDAKILCTVRNVAWIMDTIERRVRKNSLHPSRLFHDPAESDTVYDCRESPGRWRRGARAALSCGRWLCCRWTPAEGLQKTRASACTVTLL